ncbi:Uncharacterised protein [Mycobacterium tuberculosis]|nr:Uncharacterised protein [Mycobacterium tuberculosis]CNU21176.1 Uncharacterised protein [Mycobacterium tuberculosis]COV43947.1 Uncharacterised protein [Mycobacterium tuberculosis]
MAAGRHMATVHRMVAVEHRGNLTRLDAETADLHLVIAAPEELQSTVGQAAHHISGAVHSATAPVWLSDKARRSLGRAAEVTAGQLGARQIQLAGDAIGHRPQPGVHDVGAGGAGRTSDDRSRMLSNGGDHGFDRGLGRPVAVEGRHGRARAVLLDHPPRRGAQGFAAERKHRQRRPVEQSSVVQLGEHRRRGVNHVQTESVDRFDQRPCVPLTMVVDNVHRVAVKQCDQRLPRRVEGERPGMRDSQRAPEPLGRRPQHALDVVVGVGRQRPMGADDTFRGTGGAGGENHVGRLVHRHRDGTVVLEYVSANRSGEHALIDDHRSRCLAQDLGDTLTGHRRVQRHDHATRLEDRQHGGHVARTTGQRDGHRGLATHVRAAQPSGQPVGQCIQLPVRQLTIRPTDRHRVRLCRSDFGEPGMHRGCRRRHIRQAGCGRIVLAVQQNVDVAQRPIPPADQAL